MILDLTDPEKSGIKYERFIFPDGQPHLKLEPGSDGFGQVIAVRARITNPTEWMEVLLAADVLRPHAKNLHLTVYYMMGARMDRPIGMGHPFTLRVIAESLREAYDSISVLDPHSEMTPRLLDAEMITNKKFLAQMARRDLDRGNLTLVCPDEGATHKIERAWKVLNAGMFRIPIVYCDKSRDPLTGNLSMFGVQNPEAVSLAHPGMVFLIVDDICDGGGTFVGLSKVLRDLGATDVQLAVTHGIFSKGIEGMPLEGIDHIYTTSSYLPQARYERYGDYVTVIPVEAVI